MVARRFSKAIVMPNTAPKTVHGAHWTPRPRHEAEDVIGGDMAFYSGLGNEAGNKLSAGPAGHLVPD